MDLYSYKVRWDYGFAPNPFGLYLTFATCQYRIRKTAKIYDWIIGTGGNEYNYEGRLIYAMEVNEKLTFKDYWNDERFTNKKRNVTGSIKQWYGDNIYCPEGKGFRQLDSRHSLEDGNENIELKEKDLKGVYVLVSTNFYYFGKNAPLIPLELRNKKDNICMPRQGYKKIPSNNHKFQKFFEWLLNNYKDKGLLSNPVHFGNEPGVSNYQNTLFNFFYNFKI